MGNYPIGIGDRFLDRLGRYIPMGGQLGNARAAHADQRELSRDKEAVRQHQQDHGPHSQQVIDHRIDHGWTFD